MKAKKTHKKKQDVKAESAKPFQFSIYPFFSGSKKPEEWINETAAHYHIKGNAKGYFDFTTVYYGGDDLRVYPVVTFDFPNGMEKYLAPYDGLMKARHKKTEYSELTNLPEFPGYKGMINSWDIFYEHAFLSNIVFHCFAEHVRNDIAPESVNQILKPGDMFHQHKLIDDISPELDIQLIKIIKTDPLLLHLPDVIRRFIQILTFAHHSSLKKKREKARRVLEHLQPKSKGGPTPVASTTGNKLALRLIEKLVRHLQSKCRKKLNELGYDKKNYDLLSFTKEGITCDPFDDLSIWLNETKEYRLTNFSRDKLSELITRRYSRYAKDYFSQTLGSSIPTLTRKS